MTWFKVDDSFHSHPKVLATDADALGLWVIAGAWSSSNLTDGFVPTHALLRLIPGSDDLARKLVASGLWKRTKGGYQFHNWLTYQPSKEEATAGRDGMSTGGALGNHRRWHVKAGKIDTNCRYCIDRERSIGSASGPSGVHSAPFADDAVNKPETNESVGSTSGGKRHPQPDSTQPSGLNQGKPGRPTDRVPEGQPESPPNPPGPSRPGLSGGALGDPLTPGTRTAPPPSKCPDHEHLDEPPPCGRCGDLRRARTRWELADSERRRNAPKCRQHRGQPADNCALCRSEDLVDPEDS